MVPAGRAAESRFPTLANLTHEIHRSSSTAHCIFSLNRPPSLRQVPLAMNFRLYCTILTNVVKLHPVALSCTPASFFPARYASSRTTSHVTSGSLILRLLFPGRGIWTSTRRCDLETTTTFARVAVVRPVAAIGISSVVGPAGAIEPFKSQTTPTGRRSSFTERTNASWPSKSLSNGMMMVVPGSRRSSQRPTASAKPLEASVNVHYEQSTRAYLVLHGCTHRGRPRANGPTVLACEGAG